MSPDRERRPWKVLRTQESPFGDRCVDVFVRPDGSYGFEEFRCDPEDGGGWTAVGSFSGRAFSDRGEAWARAVACVPWLAELRGPGAARGL